MESKNKELDFPNFNLDKQPNATKYARVAVNLESREAVTVKSINPRSGDNGLPLPITTSRDINRGDIYSVYEVDVFEPDKAIKRGFLYVEKEE